MLYDASFRIFLLIKSPFDTQFECERCFAKTSCFWKFSYKFPHGGPTGPRRIATVQRRW